MADKKVVFKYGSRADYDAIGTKNDETLYFLTDSGEIFRGNKSLTRSHYYEVERAEAETDLAAIARVVSGKILSQDDTCIVKAFIQTGTDGKSKYSHTAYIYDATNKVWKAMDGNYNAENVYFDQDLTFTKEIGYVTLQNGKGTLASAGKNMKQILELMFAKEENPSVTQPKVSWGTVTGLGEKEVGTVVSPSYTVSLNTGSYSFGPSPTGVAAASYKVELGTNSLTTASGTFTNITVSDNMNLSMKATITHGAGVTPYTNLGNPVAATEHLAIEAGTKTATYSTALVGYRKIFYGALPDEEALDSAAIRGLAHSKKNGATTITWKAADYTNPLRYIVAIPSETKAITSAVLDSTFGAVITDNYVKQTATINVEGANGYTAVPYDIYIYRPDAGIGSDEEHTVTIG